MSNYDGTTVESTDNGETLLKNIETLIPESKHYNIKDVIRDAFVFNKKTKEAHE